MPKIIQQGSKDYNSLEYRYTQTLEHFRKIIEDKNDTIIVCDDNIDTYNDHNLHHNTKNISLKAIRDDFILKYNIVTHNFKPTFHRKNLTSCIDHIYSNCGAKINNIVTNNMILSDH